MIVKHNTVWRSAPAENTIRNFSRLIAKSRNAIKEKPCEKKKPKSNPVPSAMMPTQSASPANNREIRPFFMPSIIYTPNSFLRRFNKN